MIIKKIDEYRDKYINNSETTIGVYELKGTKNEKHITLLPKEERIIKVREKEVKEVKTEIKPVINTKKTNN